LRRIASSRKSRKGSARSRPPPKPGSMPNAALARKKRHGSKLRMNGVAPKSSASGRSLRGVQAIHQAEIEKARLDAENAARIEQLRHLQEHERQIKAMGQDKHKKRLTLLASAAGVFLVVALVGGGIIIKNQSDAAEAQRIADQAKITAMQEQQDQLQRKLKEQQDSVSQLESAVANAKDDAARAAAQQKLAEAKNQAAATTKALQNVQHSSGGGSAAPKKPCNCPAGDPLCSCIP